MDSFYMDCIMALWLGILTSLSPCPLATNIAAISYIGRRLDNRTYVLGAGLLYMLGRTIVYVSLGTVLVSSTHAIPVVALFLEKYMNLILGPLLILVGIVLLDLIYIPFGRGTEMSEKLQKKIDRAGIWGALILGIIFSLSFCPVSAGLFFGSLFSYAIRYDSRFLFPGLYGIGTAITVVGFAVLLAFASNFIGKIFNKISVFEHWARRITAIIFIGAGIYISMKYIFNIPV